MGGCAPVTEATHGVALQGILLRRANKKAAPKGGLFMCVAERGGGTDPKTSLPDCTRDANRTYGPVLCSVHHSCPAAAWRKDGDRFSNVLAWRERLGPNARLREIAKLNAPILH
jgi:hypothetical protein